MLVLPVKYYNIVNNTGIVTLLQLLLTPHPYHYGHIVNMPGTKITTYRDKLPGTSFQFLQHRNNYHHVYCTSTSLTLPLVPPPSLSRAHKKNTDAASLFVQWSGGLIRGRTNKHRHTLTTASERKALRRPRCSPKTAAHPTPPARPPVPPNSPRCRHAYHGFRRGRGRSRICPRARQTLLAPRTPPTLRRDPMSPNPGPPCS